MSPLKSFHDRALRLAGAGYRVFPLSRRAKRPLPGLKWKDKASTDASTVSAWWARHPESNIGLATGGAFFVVDIDDPDEWRSLLEVNGGELPPCPTVRTGKGQHLYFRMPDGASIANRANVAGCFDVRGAGGYVVGAGSIHPDGALYEWTTDADPRSLPLPPDWLLRLLKKAIPKSGPASPVRHARLDKYAAAALAGVSGDVANAPEGQRNHALYAGGRRLFSFVEASQLSEAVATAALMDAARAAGLSDVEAAATIGSARRAAHGSPDDVTPRDMGRQDQAGDDESARDEGRRRKQQDENAKLQEDDQDTTPPSLSVEDMLADCVWIAMGSQVGRISNPKCVLPFGEFSDLTASCATFKRTDDGRSKRVLHAVEWKQHSARRTVHTRTFHAGAAAICSDPDGLLALNSWRPVKRWAANADISPFVEQVEYLVPDPTERAAFMSWLAHIEQRPGVLPHYGWLHIAKNTGTGRNWLASLLARVWRGYVAPNVDLPALLESQFNGALAGRVLAMVDEVQEGGGENQFRHANRLKSIVNAEERAINPKFGRQFKEHNSCRWLVFSNHDNALPLNDTDRRWRVLRHDAPPRSPDAYARLYELLDDVEFINAVGVWLGERDIDAFNPGERPPMSEAKRAAVGASKTLTQQYAEEIKAHWPADVITNADAAHILSGGAEKSLTPAMRRVLDEIGAINFPRTLKVRRQVTRCWVLRNHARWVGAAASEVATEAARAMDDVFAGRSAIEILAGVA